MLSNSSAPATATRSVWRASISGVRATIPVLRFGKRLAWCSAKRARSPAAKAAFAPQPAQLWAATTFQNRPVWTRLRPFGRHREEPLAMADELELIMRAGPGTPMGELMRQYWIPFAPSDELKADGTPVRILLLNEKLIAFRDTSGRVGIMDQRCPHRCASLYFGRNEEDGIRCVYHGWKFDVDGNCLDQLNIPERQHFKDRVRAKAYLTKEHNGVVWVYMGDRNKAPKDLPHFECLMGPASGVQMRFVQRSCNWLQAVEGDLDTSHVGVLHFGFIKPTPGIAADRADLTVNRAPEYKIRETNYGLHYGAHRPSPTVPGGTYWRVAHFLFPFWIMPPVSSLENNVMVRSFIPMDDTHCMFVGFESTRFMRQNDRER